MSKYTVGLGVFLVSAALGSLFGLTVFFVISGGPEQIAKEQAHRKAYAAECNRRGGTVETFSKGSLTKGCLIRGELKMVQ